MKAIDLIADALSSWRTFEDAADLAHQHFERLDDEEIVRLALRGFTEEFRATLRKKDEHGVPLYGNVEQIDIATGKSVRRYKQTELFNAADYESAIRSCHARSEAELRTARALQRHCYKRLGIQLTLERAS